jgi:hypothetical protein
MSRIASITTSIAPSERRNETLAFHPEREELSRFAR